MEKSELESELQKLRENRYVPVNAEKELMRKITELDSKIKANREKLLKLQM